MKKKTLDEVIYDVYEEFKDLKDLDEIKILNLTTSLMELIEQSHGSRPGIFKKEVLTKVINLIIIKNVKDKEMQDQLLNFHKSITPELVERVIDLAKRNFKRNHHWMCCS